MIRHQSGAAFAKRQGFSPARLHLAHEKNPDADKYNHREPGDQNRHVPWIFRRWLGADHDTFFSENLDQIGVLRCVYLETIAVGIGYEQLLPLDNDIRYPLIINHCQKVGVTDTRLGKMLFAEKVIEHDHHQRDDQP